MFLIVKPTKAEPIRTRLTVGGYPNNCGTTTADLLLVKLLINSILSTIGARFMTGISKKIPKYPT